MWLLLVCDKAYGRGGRYASSIWIWCASSSGRSAAATVSVAVYTYSTNSVVTLYAPQSHKNIYIYIRYSIFTTLYSMALVSVNDFEQRAGELLPRSPWQYYQSGAEKELTLELNKTAYNRWVALTLTPSDSVKPDQLRKWKSWKNLKKLKKKNRTKFKSNIHGIFISGRCCL